MVARERQKTSIESELEARNGNTIYNQRELLE
jgi:hypothetical protein